jgi:FdhD protein
MNGLVVAGGKSTRMAQDKAMLNYFGKPQWQHVYDMLSVLCDEVYVSVNIFNTQIEATQIIDSDKYKDYGPIASILSAFEFKQTDWLIVAIDYPYFTMLELERLCKRFKVHGSTTIMQHNTSVFYEPFIGIYTSDFLQQAKPMVEAGELSLQNIFKQISVLALKPINETALTSVDDEQQYMKATQWANSISQVKNISISKHSVVNKVVEDFVAVEEPLEISIVTNVHGITTSKNTAVTMRTPANDEELAIGFLFTEGIISDFKNIEYLQTKGQNKIGVFMAKDFTPNIQNIERNFYTTSSCGICGKASIEAISTKLPAQLQTAILKVNSDVLARIYKEVNSYQSVFASTGGIHASALFTHDGRLKCIREDVGRHNALDKLIGAQLLSEEKIEETDILLLSGRASFELIQKAAMAQIQIVCSIGAPSSLAVQLADEVGIKLIGFLKGDRYNEYT